MCVRRSSVTALLVAVVAVVAGAAVAGASGAVAGGAPSAPRAVTLLLGSRAVPGFRLDGAPVSRRVTRASNRSCDTFGPPGSTFASETFTRGGAHATGFGTTEALAEALVVTRSPAQARRVLRGLASYARRCIGGDSRLANGVTTGPTRVTDRPAPHVRGAVAGRVVTVQRDVTSTTSGSTQREHVTLRLLAYRTSRVVVVLVPLRFTAGGTATHGTVTLGDTAGLRALASRAAGQALRAANRS